MPKPRREFDYEEVTLAARHSRTQAEFCRAIGILPTSLHKYLQNNQQLADAYARGRSGGSAAAAGEEEAANKYPEFGEREFHRFGSQRLTTGQIAEALGTNVIGINQHFSRFGKLKEAYEKGKRGIPLSDDLSIASALKNHGETNGDGTTDFAAGVAQSQNSDLGVLHEKVGVLLAESNGDGLTCAEIAASLATDARSVYNCLTKKAADGEIEKIFKTDGTARYRLKPSQPDAAKPPSPPIKKSLLSEPDRILRAVAGGNNFVRSICAATGIPGGVVIEQLEAMAGKEIFIRRETNFVAYFLAENAPAESDKLILNGKGGVRIVHAQPLCGRCSQEMIAQHYEEKVVSWYCPDCWQHWDESLTVSETEEA